MRCCAYILNLIVMGEINEVNESISQIHGASKYTRSFQIRTSQSRACVDKFKIGLCLRYSN